MRSNKNRVFGGFTRVSWQNLDGDYIEDEKAFVFSMDKFKVYRVFKPSGAIYCHHSWGPSFGGNALGLRTNPLNSLNGGQCRISGSGDGSHY